jgi:hypothetical protein
MIGRAVLHVANLPLDVNIPFMPIMAENAVRGPGMSITMN